MIKSLLLGFMAAALTTAMPASASEELAKAKGCLNCHGISEKVVGPAYTEVAKKYAGQKDAEASLAGKIIKGTSGAWGQMPMPPNSQVSAEEATKLVQWIMGLK